MFVGMVFHAIQVILPYLFYWFVAAVTDGGFILSVVFREKLHHCLSCHLCL